MFVDLPKKPYLFFLHFFDLEPSTAEKKATKNRVKFKDIESNRVANYQGPLISHENLLGDEGKDLNEIVFSKHLFIYGTRGIEGAGDHEKGYIECMDKHVEEALRKSLNMIKSTDRKDFDLVLYKEALHHAIRISRALVGTSLLPSSAHAWIMSLCI